MYKVLYGLEESRTFEILEQATQFSVSLSIAGVSNTTMEIKE